MTLFNITPPHGKPSTPNSSPRRPTISVSRQPSHGKRFQVQVLSTKGASTDKMYSSRAASLLDFSMLPFGKITFVVVREVKHSDLDGSASSEKGETLINIKFDPPAEHETVRSCKFQLVKGELTLNQKPGSEELVMKRIDASKLSTGKAGKSQRVFERTITYEVRPRRI